MSYIKIFLDVLEAVEPLDDGERGRLFTALLQYARTGQAPGLQGNERFLFPVLRAQLDREAAAYAALCEANRQKGALGGRPRKKAGAFSESQEKDKDKNKDKDKDKDKDEDEDEEKDAPKEKEELSSFRGAEGPAKGTCRGKGVRTGRRGAAPGGTGDGGQGCSAAARRSMDQMDRFLLQLRQEAAAVDKGGGVW